MKTITDQIYLELMSYIPKETSAEVRARKIFVEEFETGVNQDEVLNCAIQRMKALIESRNIHLQVPAACTSPKISLSRTCFHLRCLVFFSCSNSEKKTATCVRS